MSRLRRWTSPSFSRDDSVAQAMRKACPRAYSGNAFDDPASRDDLEAFGGIGALDDLQRPVADLGQRAARLGLGIAAVGEDMAQPRAGFYGSPQAPSRRRRGPEHRRHERRRQTATQWRRHDVTLTLNSPSSRSCPSGRLWKEPSLGSKTTGSTSRIITIVQSTPRR